MPTREDLRERIDSLDRLAWSGVVFRHLLGDTDPFRENHRGARWNPPGVSALYTSLDRETCIAEVEYRVSLDPVKPTSERRLYKIQVVLDRVVDLSAWSVLESMGFNRAELETDDLSACQQIGLASDSLGNDGLIVPSIRSNGKNLVVYPQHCRYAPGFEIVGMEVLPPF